MSSNTSAKQFFIFFRAATVTKPPKFCWQREPWMDRWTSLDYERQFCFVPLDGSRAPETDRRASAHVLHIFSCVWQKGLVNFPYNLFVIHFYSQTLDDVSALYDLELREQRNVANAQRILQQDRKAAVLYMNPVCSALLRGHPVMLLLKLPLMDPSILFSSASFDPRLFPPQNILICNPHLKHSLYIF